MNSLSPPPTFHTLVPYPRLAKLWNQLDPSERLSKLHSRYWQDDIADSRRDWWRSQQGETTVGRNEIDEECFVLDFNMHDDQCSRLWVRKDYVRIYDHCDQHFKDTMKHLGHGAPSVVITGQPGIGKAYWINYAIRRRLGEGNPFLWCRAKFCYLFAEDGVFELPKSELRGNTSAKKDFAIATYQGI
ncbi:hypothetical protein BC826DRAFT_1015754 [Russula brevipes]|nr:hypothetical protein BC826DRAFT_1015754 [Russula brevipes]